MKRYLNIVLTGLFLVFTVMTSNLIFSDTAQAASTGTLKIHMLKIDDGREDCFIVQLPNGDTMVIDISTGACTPLVNKLNALNITSVKYLVGTHHHGDHIGAINNFLNTGFEIDNTQIYFPKGTVQDEEPGEDIDNMYRAAANRGLTVTKLVRHDVILNTTYDGKLLEIRAISPLDSKVDGIGKDDYTAVNPAGLALKVTYGSKAMIFMADCTQQTENNILADTDTSDLWGQVLKVGHHGVLSGTSPTTTDAFLDKIKPQYAFITNDDLNINKDIRSRLRSRKIAYWIVGVSGTVWIATDGNNPWYYSEAPTWSAPPVITIGKYIKTPTNKDITVTAKTNVGILNETSHTFTENGSFEFIATDTASGTESRVTVTITNIDKVPPAIEIASPVNDAKYILNQNVLAEWSAADVSSGIATASGSVTNGGAIDTRTVGTKSFTVTASDKAGNITAKTITYNVIYAFGGILQPVNNSNKPENKPDADKAGSTIPVKFQLRDANNNFVINAVAKAYLAKLNNGIPGNESEAVSSGSANDGNLFRYDSASNQYVFNLSTKGWEPGTYMLTIKIDDGTLYSVQLILK